MNNSKLSKSEWVVFKPKDGNAEFQVVLDGDNNTIWVTEQQIMELFGKARRTIGYHISNIYREGELDKDSTWREFRQVQMEGGRKIERTSDAYNLDVIISVGYRVKSPIGVEFRRWATRILKEFLLKGFILNESILQLEQKRVDQLQVQVNRLQELLWETEAIISDGFLKIIEVYSRTFQLLERFDKNDFPNPTDCKEIVYTINYDDVRLAIQSLRDDLMIKGEASMLFGNEKDESLKGILGSISQTAFGQLAYPTIHDQASQLLYSIIKGHPFSDGNKRIGSFIFLWFLEQNNYHLNPKGERKITHNTMTALALLVAQSPTEHHEIIKKLIASIISD